MGSVKDLEVIKDPANDVMGIGRFHFSDRYSIFDWGEMPDHISGKGAALCLMGAYCFERLEEMNVKTHYRGLVTDEGEKVPFKELKNPTNIMELDLVNVIHPETLKKGGRLLYDYSVYTPHLKNHLIPLEIIYRNSLPEGSSIFRRLENKELTIEELGLDHYPRPGEQLSKPIFDVSTKLEEKDRYVSWLEAQRIAGLTEDELMNVKDLLLTVDETITRIALKAGFVNEDGKIELAFDPKRNLIVVDVVGTLDECRFTYNGLQVSKEIARRFYRGGHWHSKVKAAKKSAESRGVKDWRRLCQSNPPCLDPYLKEILEEMYMATTNMLTGNRFFDAPNMIEAVGKYNEYINVA
ncbi:MAG: phosphoribosylaminoimidazolesuccinocarboxamide synthase [Candidatus Bathyarchaeota archaeon]|jgi:phosphoribosylaminoimidazole-succinocarboxamide synthase